MTALTLRPEAVPAWHALGGRLLDLTDAGRSTPCMSDPDAFTSEDREDRLEAAEACSRCPVVAACARFAEDNREPAHVWAGIDRTTEIRGAD